MYIIPKFYITDLAYIEKYGGKLTVSQLEACLFLIRMGCVFGGNFGTQNCIEIADELRDAIEHKNRRKALLLRRGILLDDLVDRAARVAVKEGF